MFSRYLKITTKTSDKKNEPTSLSNKIVIFPVCLAKHKESYTREQLEMIFTHFAKEARGVVIFLADASIHSLRIEYPGKPEAELRAEASKMGDEWLSKYNEWIKDRLGSKLLFSKVLRWNDFLKIDEHACGVLDTSDVEPRVARKNIEQLLNPATRQDALNRGINLPLIPKEHLVGYFKAIEKSIGKYWSRLKGNQPFEPLSDAACLSRMHVDEESRQLILLSDKLAIFGEHDGTLIVYPYPLTPAIEFVKKHIVSPRNPNALQYGKLKFEKKKTNIDEAVVNQQMETNISANLPPSAQFSYSSGPASSSYSFPAYPPQQPTYPYPPFLPHYGYQQPPGYGYPPFHHPPMLYTHPYTAEGYSSPYMQAYHGLLPGSNRMAQMGQMAQSPAPNPLPPRTSTAPIDICRTVEKNSSASQKSSPVKEALDHAVSSIELVLGAPESEKELCLIALNEQLRRKGYTIAPTIVSAQRRLFSDSDSESDLDSPREYPRAVPTVV